MAVFLPAAFIPGLTGKMFAQFALVIAATALLSAINAATLKPTQCAMWLRPPVPPERRNLFYRGFNAVYGRFENAYAWLIGHMVARSGVMCAIALDRDRELPVTVCRGFRPASCRSRTRAMCWWPYNCRTAPRSSAPSASSTRSARSPARSRGSTM